MFQDRRLVAVASVCVCLVASGGLSLTSCSVASVPVGEARDEQNAGEFYQHVELYPQMSVARFDRVMRVFSGALGVECSHCHSGDDWGSEDVAMKHTARKEARAMKTMRADLFDGLAGPACWTCHRGETHPETLPQGVLRGPIPSPSPFRSETRPAGDLFSNLKVFGEVPAHEFQRIMEDFSVSLGVDCGHCHVASNWAGDDKPAKVVARRMVAIRDSIRDRYYEGREVLDCWSCHRGSLKPELGQPDFAG